jgi:hydroxyethylthiazole kinase-like uncharacterized protein yjeF
MALNAVLDLPALYRTEYIRAIEHQHGTEGLMERAGLAVAELSGKLIQQQHADILVLAGPGNNGGDALVAARHLKDRFNIHVLFTGVVDNLPSDARAAYEAWIAGDGKVTYEIPHGTKFSLVIDGLFGIGLTRKLDARYTDLIAAINSLPATKLAIDIPSGLCADTGRVLGAAIHADQTITFIARKPGLYTLDGPDHAGLVHVADLGVVPSPETPCGWLVDSPPATLPPRRLNSHKGSFGSVGVVGGSKGMVGAALLSGRAALLAGSGRVYGYLLAADAPLVDTDFPELMLRSNEKPEQNLDCIVIGPGMGQTPLALAQLRAVLKTTTALVLDADALHLLAADQKLRDTLKQSSNEFRAVLTPHPGEAAVLLDCDTAQIQADRIASALHIADLYQAVVVLKGAGSIIALPDGRWFVNASGNPGLSAAGMGDVLAGIIAALIAQGMSIEQATTLGVYLHGKAADELVADGIGPAGLKASEIALEVRNLLNNPI